MIKVSFINKVPKSFGLTEPEIERLVADTLIDLGETRNVLTEIWFVRRPTIKRLNLAYRNVNKPTDILSFPQSSYETGDVEILGSLVISSAVVREKDEKPTDVVKHGLLHLLGYDHETDEKAWERAAKVIGCGL